MSMNTPIGNIAQTTQIKDFKELEEMQNEQYLLGIDNNEVGNGSKISLENLINSSISADNGNLIVKGTDNRLLVNTPVEIGDLSSLATDNKTTLVKAINEVNGDIDTTQTTIGDLNNLATSDKSSVVNAINELSSVLDPTQTADYINNSKAVESGAISSNSIVYADIQKYAHSSFDLSKFTVVGAPTINGSILSGITSANYLTLPSINFGTSFTVISPVFNLKEYPAYNACIAEFDQVNLQIRQNRLYCFRHTTNKSNYDLLEGTTTLELNTDYVIKYEQTYNGTTYTINLYLSSDNGATWHLERTLERTSSAYFNYNLVYIGRKQSAGYPDVFTQGTLDLKAFACFNEGLSVFNANKNGVDVISPDNFTVVGIPALSNGILDGITSGNYLTAPPIDLGDNFEIISPLFKATGLLTTECILETDEVAIQIRDGKTYCWRYTTNKNTYDVLEGVTTLETGKYYLIKYTQTFDGTNYTLTTYLSSDFGATWTLERTLTRTEASYYNGGLIYFGRRQNAGYPNLFSNPLNLNHCTISSAKGDKYYPCVYIPYSESNTGSKIADFTYRLPVQYAYEMNGIAPYYTLDEISRNFSLPMGELYGMINKLKNSVTSMVMPDYENQILSASSVAPSTYIQCNYNSFVVVWGVDPYTVDAAGWVSPDNGVTKYRIGFFYSDLNANTKGTSFSFFVPKGWYFTSEFENNFNYAIYPLKGEV